MPEALQYCNPKQYKIKREMCLEENVNYKTNSFVVFVLHVVFSGFFSYACPCDLLSWFLKAAFSEKPNIKRLFSTPLRAGSISCFSSFWYVSTPRGVFAKPRDQQQQPFRAFLAIRLWLLSSFKLGFTDHLVVCGKLAGHMVLTHLFCFQISLSDSQTLRQSSPEPCRRSWDYDGNASCLFFGIRNYFLKRSREEKQVPS